MSFVGHCCSKSLKRAAWTPELQLAALQPDHGDKCEAHVPFHNRHPNRKSVLAEQFLSTFKLKIDSAVIVSSAVARLDLAVAALVLRSRDEFFKSASSPEQRDEMEYSNGVHRNQLFGAIGPAALSAGASITPVCALVEWSAEEDVENYESIMETYLDDVDFRPSENTNSAMKALPRPWIREGQFTVRHLRILVVYGEIMVQSRSKPPEFVLARQFCRGGFHENTGRKVAYARPHAADYSRRGLPHGRVFMRFLRL